MKKLVLFIILAGAGAYWYFVYHPQSAMGAENPSAASSSGGDKSKSAGGGSGGGKRGDSGPVPVVTGIVAKKDVPIYLNGLGNVQAFNTVTVRTRVDGQIDKIAFTEGQDVKENDLLIQIDPRPYQAAYDQAVAKKNQDEAQLTNAKVDLVRYKQLLDEKATPEKTYTTQKALVDQLDATVKADEANMEATQVNLTYTHITSPIEGRMGIRLVDQGNVVHAADTNGLVVITQLKPISVIFTLPEQDLPRIQEQVNKGELKVLALGRDDKALTSEGALLTVDNQIDTTTGTIKLKATFPNKDLALWPGQYVSVRLRLTVRPGSTVVPAPVIQRGPDGTYAFVVKKSDKGEETVDNRPVKVAFIESNEAVIESGLTPGEKVVVDGQYRLQLGSKIKEAVEAGKDKDKDKDKGEKGEGKKDSKPQASNPIS